MTALIVLSSIFLYILIGGIVGQINERIAKKTCSGGYRHDYCDHILMSIGMGMLWPFLPVLMLVIKAGVKLSKSIVDSIMGEEKR